MLRLGLLLSALVVLSCAFVHANEGSLDSPISIRLMQGEEAITLHASASITFEPEGANIEFKPGTYTIRPSQARPARQRFHLFAKTFKLTDPDGEAAYIEDARTKGYTPEVVTIGKRLQTASGRVLDTRVHWISIRQTETKETAQSLRSELIDRGQPVWIQAETIEPGTGFLQIQASGGAIVSSFVTPLTVRSSGPVEVANVDIGFWDVKREHLAYTGDFQIRIGVDAQLELLEVLPIEEYLRGVLPAEMPWSWELEALKAQAVAARSEVIASLGSRFTLQGFDFLGNEQSRAYLGAGGFKPTTDRALLDTAGQILVQGARIVPAVFSANCGGWTENNDTVWYGPPDSALRGVSGAVRPQDQAPANEEQLRTWLETRPEAYCSHDQTYFRWRRTFSVDELRDMINNRHNVGQIERIELGDRGVSGRLKWVRIHGSENVETIHKEQPIRRAFGGLPSALFVLITETDTRGNPYYVILGGGRGHGVGLCQHGAQGMAQRGMSYAQILKHYYSGVEIERYK